MYCGVYHVRITSLAWAEWGLRFRELVWDERNEAHIARHGLGQLEVEEAAFDRTALTERAKGTQGRPRYLVLVATRSGKNLVIILEPLSDGSCYVVTAREMNRSENRRYRARGK